MSFTENFQNFGKYFEYLFKRFCEENNNSQKEKEILSLKNEEKSLDEVDTLLGGYFQKVIE